MVELRLPRLKSSFCGCSLETGSKIIAYLHVLLIGAFMVIVVGEDIYLQFVTHTNTNINIPHDFVGVFVREETIFSLVLNFFVFSSLLLIGIYKRSSILLEPFIYMKVAFLIMSVFNIATYMMARVHGMKMFYIFPLLANTGLEAYMLTVVSSYKMQIDNREI